MVTEDPPTVKLRFEPSGRPGKDREYYLAEKENKCVVCGKEDGYIRKNVVPHEYRRLALCIPVCTYVCTVHKLLCLYAGPWTGEGYTGCVHISFLLKWVNFIVL